MFLDNETSFQLFILSYKVPFVHYAFISTVPHLSL